MHFDQARKQRRVAVVAAAISLIVIIANAPRKTDEERTAEAAQKAASKVENNARRHCKDTGMAFVMSQTFVNRALKAPSSAKYDYKPTATQQIADCTMRIKAYVDAQNAFGAMIRTEYVIDMQYLPEENKWRGTNLKM